MKCTGNLPKLKVLTELNKLIGFDNVRQISLYVQAFTEDGLSDEFKEWYKDRYGNDNYPKYNTTNTAEAKKLAQAVLDFDNDKHPSVKATRRKESEDNTIKFGYSNTFERDNGKNHVGTILLKVFNNNQNNNTILTTNKLDYYLKEAKIRWNNIAFELASKVSGLTAEEVKLGYKNAQDKSGYLDSLLGGKAKSLTAKNIFAVYQELNASRASAIAYINEILFNPKFSSLLRELKGELVDTATELAAEASETENQNNPEDAGTSDLDLDTTIIQLTNHIGVYTSFMTHIGERIKNYFNTLTKLSTPTIGDVDTNNSYGIAESMDSNACASMLYNHGVNFRNVTTMIEHIKHIGETIKGFEAFVQVAEDLRNNPDFANEMWTVFAKNKMAKIETVVKDGKSIVRTSNERVDSRSAMIFDLSNDVKSTVSDDNTEVITRRLVKLKKTIGAISDSLKHLNSDNNSDVDSALGKLKEDTIRLITLYYPSIQSKAVLSYIEIANEANGDIKVQIENVNRLLKDIEDANRAGEKSYKRYMEIQAKAAEISEYNKQLRIEQSKGKRFISPDQFKSTKDVYSEDFIEAQYGSIKSIVNKLLPFSIVNTDLNSRNIYGNNNSNIINSSWITKINRMMEDAYEDPKTGRLRCPVLERWGQRKLRSNQYKYSNILVEQYDEEQNVLNKDTAIFKYVDGQLCLTKNAPHIIKILGFNGSSSLDNGTNMSYDKMTTGDFLPSSFLSYFKTTDRDISNVATYFMRTPSDAPNAFTVRAPRHNTAGLFVVDDVEAYNSDVEQIIDTIGKKVTFEEYIENYRKPNAPQGSFVSIDSDDLRKTMFPTKSSIIPNANAIRKIEGSEKEDGTYDAYVSYVVDDSYIFVMQGTIKPAGGAVALHNAEYVAVVMADKKKGINLTEMPSPIHSVLTAYYSKELLKHDITIGDITFSKANTKINIKHPVYKMIRNQFKQEMLDAATALYHYFEFEEIEPGKFIVKLDEKTDEPIFKAKRSNSKGYKFYHLGKNGLVYDKNSETRKLDGNVFHSNKFTLAIRDEKGHIIKKNYLDVLITEETINRDSENINFLDEETIRYKVENNKVTDVEFTDAQNRAIDKAMSEFLSDYINQGVDRISFYEEFIPGMDVTLERVTDYMCNNLLMHFNYDELFEGNTKFYKDGQTVLKRAKEYQGSGTPYGVADYTAEFEPSLAEVENSFLNTGKIIKPVMETITLKNGKTKTQQKLDENGNPMTEEVSIQSIFDGTYNTNLSTVLKRTKQRKGFNAITIANTIKTNTKLLDELKNKLISLGVDSEIATNILYGAVQKNDDGSIKLDKNGNPKRSGGFTETKVNDAQSYITFQEWVRRIAAKGQLQRYMPLIEKVLDENQELSAEDIKEFIQVQKNFYYDIWYDSEYGIEVPRQIKNAEFILIPRFIRGTELEQVYNLMTELGIDQLNTVETSKAANETVLELWNKDGVLIDKAIKDFKKNAPANTKLYSYNNLYTQQETPQHMNAENKAGIQIVKKLIDNLPDDDSPLGKLKKEYFDIFVANIAESRNELLDELEIPRDENGNIIRDKDGNITGINYNVLLDKLKDEILRTGADSNAMDYVTIKEGNSKPEMQMYMNNFITKFESIVQSLFNNAITRQKLPGFHAAQVTNVGFKQFDKDKGQIKTDDTLHYHKNGEPYIEVRIPYSFLGINLNDPHYKGIPKDELKKKILEELAEDELDMVIGYRIPTEGKQSVCNMKIVDLLDDALGSTIVVPDEWVAQTGSDFDIDSVYGIQPNTYKDKDGRVRKLRYKHKVDENDFFNYLRDFAEKTINDNIKGNYKKGHEKLAYLMDKLINNLSTGEGDILNDLNDKQKEAIKAIDDKIKLSTKYKSLSAREAYKFRISKLIPLLKATINKATDTKFKEICQNYIDKLSQIDEILSSHTNNYSDNTKEFIKNWLNENQKDINEAINDSGLMSFEDFTNPKNIYKANSKEARSTRLFEIMTEILSNDLCLEENLSRSNFDDLIEARNLYIDPDVKAAREARSPYNVLDQIAYQEDAMSGATLKAISVSMDTFCSVCNKVRPKLNTPIRIVYNKEDFKNPQEASDRFNAGKVNKNSETFTVEHKTYGWSEDNRNIAGKILTAYSSQTSAFAFDAIKEGSIPNVNIYSFNAFKTIVNIGSDYKTAVSFIMQPGITRIINKYNASNSVFAQNTSRNPIHEAIREIAFELGINAEDNVPIKSVITSINKHYGKEFNKLFKQNGEEDIEISLDNDKIAKIPIIVSKLVDNLKHKGKFSDNSPVEKLLFDLGTALTFSRLNTIASEIGSIANCCKPDKFGAKQTVFATRQTFEDIDKCIYKKEEATGKKELRIPILEVNGKHMLASIYPGIDKPNFSVDDIINNVLSEMNISQSSYPTLCAYLKYASATSTLIAKSIFDTQRTEFVEFVTGLKNVFSGINPIIPEDVYNDFQKYILSSIYNKVDSIKYGVQVRQKGDSVSLVIDPRVEKAKSEEERQALIDAEKIRIYGYGKRNNIYVEIYNDTYIDGKPRKVKVRVPFTVKNVNRPTKDEIELFEQLSPAQKVKWIQSNFADAGIFGYINANLYNSSLRGRLAGMQTLEFTEQNLNPNGVYEMFNEAFYNDNPLIVSAAIDIVKYAVQVEGLKMSAKAVNKVIDNDCLINEFGSEGLGFMSSVSTFMSELGTSKSNYYTTEQRNELYENYLRSHPDLKGIKTFYLSKQKIKRYGLYHSYYGAYYLKVGTAKDSAEANKKDFDSKMASAGIKTYLPISDKYKTNKYIRIVRNGVNKLYKIHDGVDFILLTPLGNLEANENSVWSSNEDNNHGILRKDYYDALFEAYKAVANDVAFDSDFVKSKLNEFEKKDMWYKDIKVDKTLVPATEFNLEEVSKETAGAAEAIDIIKKHFSKLSSDRLFINKAFFYKYIHTPGIEYGTTQKITFDNGNVRTFRIFIPEKINLSRKTYLTGDKDGKIQDYTNVKNPYFKDIVRAHQQNHLKYFSGLVEVTEVENNEDNEAMAASFEEFNSDVIDMAIGLKGGREFTQGKLNPDENPNLDFVSNFLNTLNQNDINQSLDSLKRNRELGTREVANFARKLVRYISDDLTSNFVEDPDNPGYYLNINDDKVLGLVRTSAKLNNKFMTAINTIIAARNILEKYKTLNITSEDEDIEQYIKDIRKAYDQISELPIDDLVRKEIQISIDNLSTNPLHKEGLLDIFNGYWKTYGSMWKYHDVAENGTPILQVILKDVMGDIDAKKKMSIKTRKRLQDKISDIRRRAAAAGKSINMANIIDDEGDFIRDFKKEFREDYQKLKQTRDEAIKLHGLGSIEHLKADLDVKEFLAAHCHQEANPLYYKQKNALVRGILYGLSDTDPRNPYGRTITAHPEAYSEYMKLFYERLQLYDYIKTDGMTQDLKNKLDDINFKMYNLVQPGQFDYNGEIKDRPYMTQTNQPSWGTMEEWKLYSDETAEELGNVLEGIRKLEEKYYKYDASYGFESQLHINLNKIASFEKRVNGVPTVPQDVLDAIPEYVKAKRWIKNNAKFVFEERLDPTTGKITGLGARLKAAFKILMLSNNGKTHYTREKLKENDAYDELGNPIGSKLTAFDRELIKGHQRAAWGVGGMPAYTDRILLSNASPIEDIFSDKFYASMKYGGDVNPKYLGLVTKINTILEKYYDPMSKTVDLHLIPDNAEGIAELKELGDLYQELRKIRKTNSTDSNGSVKDFLENEVEFVLNEPIWITQNKEALKKSPEFIAAWNLVAYERTQNGEFYQENGKWKANRYLYTYLKPKGQPGNISYDKWIDHSGKTEAMELVDSIYQRVPTKYYYQAMHEAMAKEAEAHRNGTNDFDYMRDWYIPNHIYNPFTRKVEPLDCWVVNQIRPEKLEDNTFEGAYVPKNSQREKTIKDGMVDLGVGDPVYDVTEDKRDHQYNADGDIYDNYVVGSQRGKYDSNIQLNEYEKELKDLLYNTLLATAKVESARRFFKGGHLPRVHDMSKFDAKRALKTSLGIVGIDLQNENNGKKPWYDSIGYEFDRTPPMPMTELLNSKITSDLQTKLKDLRKNEPTREQYPQTSDGEQQYQKDAKEWLDETNKLEEAIRKERKDILNKDWINVIDTYLERAAQYNAVLENKQKLYFLLNAIRDMKMYSKEYGYAGNLKIDSTKSSKDSSSEDAIYESSIDTNLITQLETTIRRLLFNQYKEREGNITRNTNILQAFASANYMMLNMRAGVANVNLGETAIIAEAAAKEFFHPKDWIFGTSQWMQGSIGFARSGYLQMFSNDGKAVNKQDAIIKYMNVVDYDEITGVVRDLNIEEVSKKIRDFMFSPQTIGEHFMQNSVLFAMMNCHKVFKLANGDYAIMNKTDFMNYKYSEILESVLTDEQKVRYKEFKDSLLKDKNKLKDYEWFRKDALTDFIYLHLDKAQRDEFKRKRKEKVKELEKEFNEKVNLYNQVKLGEDGKMAFVDGSDLFELDNLMQDNLGEVTIATALLGRFSEKVRKVNNKIHGVYNRIGAAHIESKWYGSIVMQYHKHLPIGLLKRYMSRGHYNETRGTVDKGMVQSVVDVARLNYRKIRVEAGMTEEQVNALEGFTFLLTNLHHYLSQLKETLEIIPSYEKANIMRNLGDAIGVVGAMCIVAALWYIANDNDDLEESLGFNFFLYEADRLASEAFLYNPLGLMNESKKLMSTPIAAQSIISDGLSSLKAIADWMLDDEFDPYYHSGRFAGEPKLSVYIQRRVPIWNGIRSVLDTPANNHYYKLGQNPIGLFDIKKRVTED